MVWRRAAEFRVLGARDNWAQAGSRAGGGRSAPGKASARVRAELLQEGGRCRGQVQPRRRGSLYRRLKRPDSGGGSSHM